MENQDVRETLRPGQLVKIHQKIKETTAKGEKERIQIYEGRIIARHGKIGPSATITVRKESHGIGVEKIFPIFSPLIAKMEVVSQAKVHSAKLYYLRNYKKKLKEVK